METKKLILAGGSGFLGQAIIDAFKDYAVVVLTRNPKVSAGNASYVKWDGKSLGDWAKELENSSVIISLTGRSVDCRYSKKNKREILESRVDSTKIIGKAIKNCSNPPPLWINSGSATIFRHVLDREMNEETGELGEGFSVDVCKKWEAAFNAVETPETRKVILRIAMVLGKNGGVLPVLARLVKFGLGGKLGKGNQYVSWVHVNDFITILKWVIEHKEIAGAYNCTSPNQIPNGAFMKLLRKACKMPFGLPASEWMLEIGAIALQTETELILKSRRVVPLKLLKSGFKFQYPEVEPALNDLLK